MFTFWKISTNSCLREKGVFKKIFLVVSDCNKVWKKSSLCKNTMKRAKVRMCLSL